MNDPTHFITLQQQLAEKLEMVVIGTNADQFSRQLAMIINHLILNDMNKLLAILYRVDVAEEKVLKIIQENSIPEASQLIAEALISRQLQKIQNRENTPPADDIPEDEKW